MKNTPKTEKYGNQPVAIFLAQHVGTMTPDRATRHRLVFTATASIPSRGTDLCDIAKGDDTRYDSERDEYLVGRGNVVYTIADFLSEWCWSVGIRNERGHVVARSANALATQTPLEPKAIRTGADATNAGEYPTDYVNGQVSADPAALLPKTQPDAVGGIRSRPNHLTPYAVALILHHQYKRDGLPIKEDPRATHSHPWLRSIFRAIGRKEDDGALAWCSIAMTWFARHAGTVTDAGGLTGYDHTTSLSARSWAKVGRRLAGTMEEEGGVAGMVAALRRISAGAVVVSWRGSRFGWTGHVTFFTGKVELIGGVWKYEGFGGNQRDALRRSWYPVDRVLAVRELLELAE